MIKLILKLVQFLTVKKNPLFNQKKTSLLKEAGKLKLKAFVFMFWSLLNLLL